MQIVEYQLWNDNEVYDDEIGLNNQMDTIVSKTGILKFAHAKDIHYNHGSKSSNIHLSMFKPIIETPLLISIIKSEKIFTKR